MSDFATRFIIDGEEKQVDFQALGNFPVMQKGQILKVTEVDENGVPTKWEAGSPASSRSVTLTVEGWALGEDGRYAQTVAVEGVTADELAQLVIVSPASSTSEIASAAGVACSGQGENSLTFTAETAPTADVVMNVFCLNATSV